MYKLNFQIYPHFVKRMQAFYEENQKITECDIALLGDSLVEMMDVNLFHLPHLKIMNRGIVSDKTTGVLLSLDSRIQAIHPKCVYLQIGSNDICDGYLLKQIQQNEMEIIERMQHFLPECKIIISTILPPCYYQADHVDAIYPNCRDIAKIKEMNQWILKLSQIYPNLQIFDAFTILADENDSLRLDDTLDGVHLTTKAYEKLINELKKLF